MELKHLIENQRSVLKEYEKVLEDLEKNQDIKNLDEMKQELDNLSNKVVQLTKTNKHLSDENLNLKYTLKKHCAIEKISILENSKNKVKTYFQTGNENKLQELENNAKARMHRMNNAVERDLQENYESIQEEINEFGQYIKNKVDNLKDERQQAKQVLMLKINEDYETLMNEEIDDNTINKRIKDRNIEAKIGLNIFNKIGIILMLLGVVTLFQYSYSNWFGNYIKSIIGFTIGIFFILSGEWLNKKEQSIFSNGMTGLGIGALYISIFNSFFVLKTINLTLALFLSLLITILSIVLSVRYNSKTISIVSLIGGYLPLLSYGVYYGLIGNYIYISMLYLLLLNMSVLVVNYNKRWMSVQYTSLLLNLPTSLYLAFASNNLRISLIYLLLVFFMYLGIVINYPVKNNVKIKTGEIVLLALHTIVNSTAIYVIFNELKWNSFMGLLALIYAIGYFALGKLLKDKGDEKSSDLFLLTALTFTVLMIPLQFGIKSSMLGWLIEAVLLLYIAYTKYKNDKMLTLVGWVILAFSVVTFFAFDYHSTGLSYYMSYIILTVALLYIMFIAVSENRFTKIYKYLTLLFIWNFGTDMIDGLFINNLYKYSDSIGILLKTGHTITTGYIYNLYNKKEDKVISGISMFLYVVAIAQALINTGIYIDSSVNKYLVIGTILIYNMLALVGARELLNMLIRKTKMNFEVYFLLLAIYIFMASSLFINSRFYNVSYVGLLANIIYILLSFGYIFYGFKERKLLLRRFGLGLTFYSLVKLFLIEFTYVNPVGKIIAYFIFGIILLAISFMYQRLEKTYKEESVSNEE